MFLHLGCDVPHQSGLAFYLIRNVHPGTPSVQLEADAHDLLLFFFAPAGILLGDDAKAKHRAALGSVAVQVFHKAG